MGEDMMRILLAEDDRFLRKAAAATLRRQGFEVCSAADGEEALYLAQIVLPDLILLDLIMPKLHGFEVLRRLKQNPATANIPVIVLSNLGQESDIQQALESGASAYYIKANLSLQDLGKGDDPLSGIRLYRGRGCAQCQGTGFRGRLGVFELFEMSVTKVRGAP
jgi:CheY-like chemotaxis protein